MEASSFFKITMEVGMSPDMQLLLWFWSNLKNYRPFRRKLKTREKYKRCCTLFLKFVGKKYHIVDPYSITQDHYADFIRYLHQRGLSKTTINRTYKLALKWLAENFNLNFKVRIRRDEKAAKH